MSAGLYQKIKDLISRPESPGKFEDLCLELFDYQVKNNPIYRQWAIATGKTRVEDWTEIPLVTTDLFKYADLICARQKPVKLFLSSGTTQANRSRHFLSSRELELYQLSLWQSFGQAFNLSSEAQVLYLVLAEGPQISPDSSLNHMFEVIRLKLAASESSYLIDAGGPKYNYLEQAIAHKSNWPVILVGTAYAFVHLIESGLKQLSLPAGSAIMETGGFKGLSREFSRSELYQRLSSLFDIPPTRIVGQYGMSEIGTQFYDQVLIDSSSPSARWKQATRWCRFRILAPYDLSQEVEIGQEGLIALYDLSNLDSCAFILTGDLAIRRSHEAFELIGRASTITPKGCSMASEKQFSPALRKR